MKIVKYCLTQDAGKKSTTTDTSKKTTLPPSSRGRKTFHKSMGKHDAAVTYYVDVIVGYYYNII